MSTKLKIKEFIKKMEEDGFLPFWNKICWRCSKKFYHGFSDICMKCDKEIKSKGRMDCK